VECWIESITASTSTASNYSIRYVDQDGNASETSPVIPATIISTVGMMQRFNLNAGDTGVRSVDQFISTGASGGTAQLVLMRRIAEFPVRDNTVTSSALTAPAATNDFLETGLATIPNDACLAFVWLPAISGGAPSWGGSMNIVQA